MTAQVSQSPAVPMGATERHGRWLPVTAALAVLLVTGFGLALWATASAGPSVATPAELAVVLGLVGSFICWHKPGERIGWLMGSTGLAFAVGVLAVGALAVAASGAAVPVPVQQSALAWRWLTIALPVPWALLVAWFPDGRFTRPGWRIVVVAGGAVALTVAVSGYLFGAGGEVPGIFTGAPQPAGLAGPLSRMHATWPLGAGDALTVLPLVAVPALVARYRVGDALVRQQVRWLLAGAVGAIIGAGVVTTLGGASLPGLAIALVSQPLPAAAIAVAVLRYRLWDVDVVVSRALVYALLWAVLSVVLLTPEIAAGLLVGGQGTVTAVGLALLVTVAFQPVRTRLEHLAERVAYRHRPRGYALLARLGQQLRGSHDVGAATVDGLHVGLGVSWAGIWVRVEVGARQALRPLAVAGGAGHGPTRFVPSELTERLATLAGPVTEPRLGLEDLWPGRVAVLVPLVTGTELVGVLACGERPGDPLGAADLELLDALGHECTLALRTRRLETELRERLDQIEAQAAELRRSRQRLVAAQDEQRRHIERDLHDGVQQQLVALAAGLRRLSSVPEGDLAPTLSTLAGEAEEAVFALQDLARGIFPAVLADRGLGAALQAAAGRSALAVRVETEPKLTGLRLGADVESALYFVALEAMANATKHAPTAQVTVALRTSPDGRDAVLEVHDNGPGFDPMLTTHGTGLQNMTDRVAAVGGALTVEARPGSGVWVCAHVPLPGDETVVPLTGPRLA